MLHKQGKRLYNTLREVISEHLLNEVGSQSEGRGGNGRGEEGRGGGRGGWQMGGREGLGEHLLNEVGFQLEGRGGEGMVFVFFTPSLPRGRPAFG